jgi:hypothetical protein
MLILAAIILLAAVIEFVDLEVGLRKIPFLDSQPPLQGDPSPSSSPPATKKRGGRHTPRSWAMQNSRSAVIDHPPTKPTDPTPFTVLSALRGVRSQNAKG